MGWTVERLQDKEAYSRYRRNTWYLQHRDSSREHQLWASANRDRSKLCTEVAPSIEVASIKVTKASLGLSTTVVGSSGLSECKWTGHRYACQPVSVSSSTILTRSACRLAPLTVTPSPSCPATVVITSSRLEVTKSASPVQVAGDTSALKVHPVGQSSATGASLSTVASQGCVVSSKSHTGVCRALFGFAPWATQTPSKLYA